MLTVNMHLSQKRSDTVGELPVDFNAWLIPHS